MIDATFIVQNKISCESSKDIDLLSLESIQDEINKQLTGEMQISYYPDFKGVDSIEIINCKKSYDGVYGLTLILNLLFLDTPNTRLDVECPEKVIPESICEDILDWAFPYFVPEGDWDTEIIYDKSPAASMAKAQKSV